MELSAVWDRRRLGLSAVSQLRRSGPCTFVLRITS
jgi:hypothetical protein